jgi:hypothetical protein
MIGLIYLRTLVFKPEVVKKNKQNLSRLLYIFAALKE